MGPLIPNGIIPHEWSSLVAVLIGFAFGFILEASGLSSSRKLAGVFYGYDFVVLRVFFTAGITAAIGLYYMNYLGWVDIKLLYIHPTFIHSALLGGVMMGLGFIVGGFCPGTSLCAAAIGKLDAMIFVGGSIIGILVFSEFFHVFEGFYNKGFWGHVIISDTLGISAELFLLIFTVIAVVAFYISTLVRRKAREIFY